MLTIRIKLRRKNNTTLMIMLNNLPCCEATMAMSKACNIFSLQT